MPTETEIRVEPARSLSLPLGWGEWLSRGIAAVMVGFAGYACFRPLFVQTPWMQYFDDDFYYYLKVAQNFAHGHGSTFDGIVPTNGYHPLWFLMLTGLSLVTTRPQAIFAFVSVVLFVCTVSIYFLTRRLLWSYGVLRSMSCVLAIYATNYCMRIMFGGMEIVLALPLLLLVVQMARSPTLFERGWRGFFLLGLTCSAMIMARLDSALLAALILLSVLAYPELRGKFTKAGTGGLLLGLLPVPVYLATNLIFFGMLLPVSGAAKQMRSGYLPSLEPWKSVFDRPASQLINFLPIVIAIALVLVLRRRLPTLDRAVLFPVLIFPFFYVAVLSLRSDWGLWNWYLYPFRSAFCMSLAVIAAVPVIGRFLEQRWVFAVVLVIGLFRLSGSTWGVNGRSEIYAAAVDLQEFAKSHPGTYAMGDRSGMPAYLIPYPMIQLEGLAMDRQFLEKIRRQEPLREVLANYKVRYYVATSAFKLPQGCFTVAEPANAGPASPHMRGEFCNPVAIYQHGAWYTLVYDLGVNVADGRSEKYSTVEVGLFAEDLRL